MTDDLQLLRAWKAGDEAAGRTLVQRHMRALDSFVRSIVPTEVEDLIQRTWLAALQSVDRFRAEGTFRAFVFGVARHQILDHFRRSRRDRERFDPSVSSVEDLSPSPSQLAAARREHQLLLQGLRQLPLDDQIIIELTYWEGLTSAELSVALDIPANTVRSRLVRARRSLGVTLQRIADSPSVLESTTSDLAGWATSLREHLRVAEGVDV